MSAIESIFLPAPQDVSARPRGMRGHPALRELSLAIAGLLALAGCIPTVAPPAPTPPPEQPQPSIPPSPLPSPPPVPPPPATAVAAGVRAGPPIVSLGLDRYALEPALEAFRISCRSVSTRIDASGLTRADDWRPACNSLATAPASPLAFFSEYFEVAEVGAGEAFATGYFEPEIRGSRVRAPGYEIPVYAKPPDLLETNPLTGAKGRGRLDENGTYGLYYDRAEIEDGVLAGRGLEIAWAADPVDFFFLQIQGSGRLLLPDGGVMRIGYANQNGREYIAIGRIMRERGILQTGGTSMQDITAFLRSNPEQGRAIMRENKSYIFFRELTGPGPLGALGLPVTPRATVAADPKFVPLGAAVVLSLDRAEASGVWVAQDTGGAIKGANRFDTFWGAGADAARIAGGMLGKGRAYILLPKGTVARLTANAARP